MTTVAVHCEGCGVRMTPAGSPLSCPACGVPVGDALGTVIEWLTESVEGQARVAELVARRDTPETP